MEYFDSEAIILSLRPHMDKGVVLSAFTRDHGRHAGFAYKSVVKDIECGAMVDLRWEARVSDMLGLFKDVHINKSIAPLVMNIPYKLVFLQSLSAICDTVLPEREPHHDLFEATLTYLNQLVYNEDPLIAGATYVMWELMVLKALGYGLDLTHCVQTKSIENLIYVSPKTGKAVCAQVGEPYKDRLLTLPPFLRPVRSNEVSVDDVIDGLKLTQTFFEKWVLTHMNKELPMIRHSVAGTLERAAHHL